MNSDFVELLAAFNAQSVEYLVVGAHALAAHGHVRATKDLARPGLIFQMGVEPVRIDVINRIDGVEFDNAWPDRMMARLGGEDVPVLSRAHLIANKKAAGRLQDLADVERLERLGSGRRPS